MPEPRQETFGERLQRLREIAKLNATEFAAIVQVSPATISLYESGKRSPNLRFLINLRKQFHVSIDGFIDALMDTGTKGD